MHFVAGKQLREENKAKAAGRASGKLASNGKGPDEKPEDKGKDEDTKNSTTDKTEEKRLEEKEKDQQAGAAQRKAEQAEQLRQAKERMRSLAKGGPPAPPSLLRQTGTCCKRAHHQPHPFRPCVRLPSVAARTVPSRLSVLFSRSI